MKITQLFIYTLTSELVNDEHRELSIYSSQSQKLIDAGDTAFDKLPEITRHEYLWGRGEVRGRE